MIEYARRFLVLFVLAALAAGGDHNEAVARLRAAKGATARAQAIAGIAAVDSPEAAAYLTKLWNTSHRALPKLRRDLYKARSKVRRARRKPQKRGDSASEIAVLNQKIAVMDGRVSTIELEMAAIVAGLESMKAPSVAAWMVSDGLRLAQSAVLREMFARKGGTVAAGVTALLDRIAVARNASELIPLLRALKEVKDFDPDERLPVLLAHLGSKDWGVRVATAHVLAHTGRVEAIAPMIRTLGKQAERSRAQREIADALQALTGQTLGPFPNAWKKWWRDNEQAIMDGKVDLELDRHKSKARDTKKLDQGRIYGIPQQADRIIYVFDRSGSMDVSMRRPRFLDGGAIPADDDEDSRYDAASRELAAAISRLRRDTLFAVVLYSDEVGPLHDELVPATKEAVAGVKTSLERTGPSGSTNIYAAIDYALRLANVHPDAKPGAAKADAIYLISDGSPTGPNGKVEDPARTLQAVREWNALQRVAIHTIGIGRSHNAIFLRALAEQNGGEYHAVLPKK